MAANCSRRRGRGRWLFRRNVCPCWRAIVFIGRKHFADAVNSNGLILDKPEGQERIAIKATVNMSSVRDCSLILFCVKANYTSATAREMASFVRPNATVVCLQN